MQTDQIAFLTQHPKVRTARTQTEWLHSTERYPPHWCQIAQNGGTLLENLLYLLDHDHAIDRTGPTHDRQRVHVPSDPVPDIAVKTGMVGKSNRSRNRSGNPRSSRPIPRTG